MRANAFSTFFFRLAASVFVTPGIRRHACSGGGIPDGNARKARPMGWMRPAGGARRSTSDVKRAIMPSFEIFITPQGRGGHGLHIKKDSSRTLRWRGRMKSRRCASAMRREIIIQEEAEKLVDQANVNREGAYRRSNRGGIVFLERDRPDHRPGDSQASPDPRSPAKAVSFANLLPIAREDRQHTKSGIVI